LWSPECLSTRSLTAEADLTFAHQPSLGRRRERSRRTTGSTHPGRACGKRRCSPGSAARRRTAPRKPGTRTRRTQSSLPLFPFGGRRRPAPPGTVTRERSSAPSSHQYFGLSPTRKTRLWPDSAETPRGTSARNRREGFERLRARGSESCARVLRSRRADRHVLRAAHRVGRFMIAEGALARRANGERLAARTIGRDHVLALIA